MGDIIPGAPVDITIYISGVEDWGNIEASNLNGSWKLPWVGSIGDWCVWIFVETPEHLWSVSVQVSLSPTEIRVYGRVRNDLGVYLVMFYGYIVPFNGDAPTISPCAMANTLETGGSCAVLAFNNNCYVPP